MTSAAVRPFCHAPASSVSRSFFLFKQKWYSVTNSKTWCHQWWFDWYVHDVRWNLPVILQPCDNFKGLCLDTFYFDSLIGFQSCSNPSATSTTFQITDFTTILVRFVGLVAVKKNGFEIKVALFLNKNLEHTTSHDTFPRLGWIAFFPQQPLAVTRCLWSEHFRKLTKKKCHLFEVALFTF